MLIRTVTKYFLISALILFFSLVCGLAPVYAQTGPAIQLYSVANGDTLWLLAQRYGTTAEVLGSLNPKAKAGLFPGQALYLPVTLEDGNIRYRVQKGDTLSLISSRTSRGIKEIELASQINSDALVPGQILHIPAARTGYTYYLVKAGDVLWTIAQNNGLSVSDLMAINRLSTSAIMAGQILEIPRTTQQAEFTLYRVVEGDYLSTLATRFGTTVDAIYQTNQLHSDILMPGQPLFIPKGRTAVKVNGPTGLKKEGKGEFLPWDWARWIYNNGSIATIIDWQTGKRFQVRHLGGSNHADSEPLTAADTKIMASLYPNGWSWATRPILLQVGSRILAASMAGMPHDVKTIQGNNFNGHFDLYFYNSRSHNTNELQPNHQANVLQAAGLTGAEADAFVAQLAKQF